MIWRERFIYLGIIAALLLTIWGLLDSNTRLKREKYDRETEAPEIIKANQQAAIEHEAKAVALVKAATIDSLSSVKELQPLVKRVAVKRAELPKTMPVLEFLTVNDSLFNGMQIAAQIQVATLKQALSERDSAGIAKDNIIAAQNLLIEKEKRETRKEHNGKVFWKIATIAAFLAASFEASQH